jgi:hypothetical protein
MEQSFQELMSKIISRIYYRDSQKNSRIILGAYFSQPASQYRSLTLEKLASLPELNKKLTRERSRQILSKFQTIDLKKEVELLEYSQFDSPDMQIRQREIRELRAIVQSIVDEIDTFTLPIFSWRVQNRLVRKGLISNDTFLHVIVDVAEAFSIAPNFFVADYNGSRIILPKDGSVKEFTSDIVSYAGALATHMGGCSTFDSLFYQDLIKSKFPKSILSLDSEVAKKYLNDLFKSERTLMLLEDGNSFAFSGRDERLSGPLCEIFHIYKNPIEKEVLISAVTNAIRFRFMGEANSKKREEKLNILGGAANSFDEYCLRIGLLEEVESGARVAGPELLKMLKNHSPSSVYKSQAKIVRAIQEKGRPVESMEFGELKSKLKIPSSHSAIIHTYPNLFLRLGKKRRNYEYELLDGVYQDNINKALESESIKPEKILKKIASIKDDLLKDEDQITVSKYRVEQSLLRQFLFEKSSKKFLSDGLAASKCMLCNRLFPSFMLIAAHVKKRSACERAERLDVENIAMLQCASCDKIFENGYVYIDDSGHVRANDTKSITEDLDLVIQRLDGNKTDYFNGSEERLSYIRQHRRLVIPPFLEGFKSRA